ncbi:DHA2 family efflux MFS transporter permease subunit [Propylenella binzhouense]|nr:DHA2 family efflux MFS transporter permease subunit [Propylenella binzhouense]
MPDRILLPLIVACALFMENLDSTILATALPTIAREFGTSPVHLKLALTSYLLSLAIFIPASGWMADRFGARHVFRMAILVFTVGSILCGLSSSLPGLVMSRIVQGMGGAMMVPVGRLVILRSIEKRDFVGAMAWLTVPALIGPVTGPPLGGFITTYLHWRWVFFVNVPIGVLGLVLATLYVPAIRGDAGRRFDFVGYFLAGLGIAGFVTGSTSLGLGIFPGPVVAALLAAGTGSLLLYYRHSRRAPDPILDLTLFRMPSFRLALVGASLFRVGVGGTPFLLPLMMQIGFGMTAFHSGLITFASALGAMSMKFFAPPLLKRFGFRRILIANAFVAALFIAIPAVFTPATPVAAMIALLLIGGFFRSLQFTSANALVFADVPPGRMSHATSLSSVAQQVALSVGISIGAMALEFASRLGGGEINVDSFRPAFVAIGAVAALSAFVFMRLGGDVGMELSGHAGGRRRSGGADGADAPG